jgi:hypothetical protein
MTSTRNKLISNLLLLKRAKRRLPSRLDQKLWDSALSSLAKDRFWDRKRFFTSSPAGNPAAQQIKYVVILVLFAPLLLVLFGLFAHAKLPRVNFYGKLSISILTGIGTNEIIQRIV